MVAQANETRISKNTTNDNNNDTSSLAYTHKLCSIKFTISTTDI